jgi:hypothetical protein
VSEVKVRIGADTAELEQGVKRSKQALTEMRGELSAGIGVAAKWGAGMAAAGAAAYAALAVKGLQAVDAQAKLARNLGATNDAVRSLSIAASDAGVSSGALTSAMSQLNQRIGEARTGSGAAAESMARLGVSADDLSRMDADERMATLADRFSELGMSSSAVQYELRQLGIRGNEMVAFMQSGGGAIRAAQQEVEDLGLSLSAIDAAKVEQANDAFARIGLLVESVSQRIAIELAPILTALSEMFVDNAKAAGGVGEVTSKSFDAILKAIGFTMDAMEGLKRTFEVAGRVIAMAMVASEVRLWATADAILNGPIEAVNLLIETMNKIPGVDIEKIGLTGLGESARKNMGFAVEALRIGQQDIQDILMAPMPSSTFETFVQGAREAATAAAEAAVEAQAEVLSRSQGGGGIAGLLGGGETDEEKEKRREDLAAKVEAIREANLSELEAMQEKLDMEREILTAAREAQLIDEETHNQMVEQVEQSHQDKLTDINEKAAKERADAAQKEAQARQQAISQMFGNLTTMMNTGSRKMFEIGKAAAIANALIDGKAAVLGAYKVGSRIGGPPVGAAFAGAAAAATYSQIQSIRSQSFGGGGGASGSITGAINDASEPVRTPSQSQEPDRSVSVTVALTGGTERDQMVASSILEQINAEIERGGRISRVGIA